MARNVNSRCVLAGRDLGAPTVPHARTSGIGRTFPKVSTEPGQFHIATFRDVLASGSTQASVIGVTAGRPTSQVHLSSQAQSTRLSCSCKAPQPHTQDRAESITAAVVRT